MKKQLFKPLIYFSLIVCCIITAGSCKKGDNGNGPEDSAPEYYINFKVNGVQKKYTIQALASLGHSDQDGLYNGILQGFEGTASPDKEHLGIVILSNVPVAANTTYQDPQKATNSNNDKIPKVMINYYDNAGDGYLSLGGMVDENGNPLPGINGIVANAKVSVTKLTSAYIEGTFSGTVFLSTDATFKTKVAITEGKFILKRLQ